MRRWCRVHGGLLGLLLGLALAVSACAVHYTKPGASVKDFEVDKARCDYEVSTTTASNPSLVTYYDLMKKCLAARGWRPTQS
jgi:hypothetical protein